MTHATSTLESSTVTSGTTSASLTRTLLRCGIAAGPLFIGLNVLQILTRDGFDLRRHAVSVLALGDQGWIQVANFILSGLLTVALAVGLKRALGSGRASTWGPILVAVNGVGLILGGLFTTDPGAGFPKGASEALPTTLSWHATIHQLGFILAVLSITAAAFVFARRFARLRQGRWVAYCVATGIGIPAFVVAGLSSLSAVGVLFFVVALLMSGWVTAVAAELLSETQPGD